MLEGLLKSSPQLSKCEQSQSLWKIAAGFLDAPFSSPCTLTPTFLLPRDPVLYIVFAFSTPLPWGHLFFPSSVTAELSGAPCRILEGLAQLQ